MADIALPIVNAVDELRQSNKAASEALRTTLNRGLFEVVKSVNRLSGIRTASSANRAEAKIIEQPAQQEANIYDKIQALTGFLTQRSAKDIATMETKQRETEQKLLVSQSELTKKYSTLQGKFTETYARTGIAQAEIYQKMLIVFSDMKMMLENIASITASESERQMNAQLRSVMLQEQLLAVWRNGPASLEDQAKREMFRISQGQSADEIRLRSLNMGSQLGLGDPALEGMIVDLKNFQKQIGDSMRKVENNTQETADGIEDIKDDNENEERKRLREHSIWVGKFGLFGDTFKKMQESLTGIRKDAKERHLSEGEGFLGGALSKLFGIVPGGAKVGMMAGRLTWRMLAWAAPYVANPVVAAALIAAAGLMWYNEYSKEQNQAQINKTAADPTTRGQQSVADEATGGALNWQGKDIHDFKKELLAKELQAQDPTIDANEAMRQAEMLYQSRGMSSENIDPEAYGMGVRELSGKEEAMLAQIDKKVELALARGEMQFIEQVMQKTGVLTAAQDARLIELESTVKRLTTVPTPSSVESTKPRVGAEVNGRSAAQAAQAGNVNVKVEGSPDNSTQQMNVNNGSTIMQPAAAGKSDKQSSSAGGAFARP